MLVSAVPTDIHVSSFLFFMAPVNVEIKFILI